MVRVRFWRVDLAALPMCHLHLIRPHKRMGYDEDNALKDQDNRQGFTAAPLNAMECGMSESIPHGMGCLVVCSSLRHIPSPLLTFRRMHACQDHQTVGGCPQSLWL